MGGGVVLLGTIQNALRDHGKTPDMTTAGTDTGHKEGEGAVMGL
jgi:hypothetical protein